MSSDAGRKAALDQLREQVDAWRRAGKGVIFVLDNPISSRFTPVEWRLRLAPPRLQNYPASARAAIPQRKSNYAEL
ncbi:MAG: hypothetical protein VW935_10955 [Novosphingobium sp.]